MAKTPARASFRPAAKPAREQGPAKPRARPRQGGRKAAGPAARGGWVARLFGGASWLGVSLIVLSILVVLPIAAAVLGDIWAILLGTLIGGFALGRATAR